MLSLNYMCYLHQQKRKTFGIFYGALTLNNGKLVGFLGSPWYSIVLNRNHFLILCSMKERLCPF